MHGQEENESIGQVVVDNSEEASFDSSLLSLFISLSSFFAAMLSASATATRRLPLGAISPPRSCSGSRSSVVGAAPRTGLARRSLQSSPISTVAVVVSASSSDDSDSDALYLAKFAASSVAGAALIKYGSMFISPPSHPDGRAAAALVALPTLFYCLLLAVWSRKMEE